ncbi:MAG: VOC family protein [Bacteroidales bacterium]|nr:VOC family protein [Candidatus Cacconaster merdequi]
MARRFRFNTIALFTRDNRRIVEFYTKVLGFTTDWDGVQPNVEMSLDGMRILLFPRKEFEKMVSRGFTYPESINGTMEISLDVPSFPDVDKEFQNAIEMGATPVLEPVTESWGQRTCYIADPDGNLIEISSFN